MSYHFPSKSCPSFLLCSDAAQEGEALWGWPGAGTLQGSHQLTVMLSNHPASSISADTKTLKLTATDHKNKNFLRAAAFSIRKQPQPVTFRKLEQISLRKGFINSKEYLL